MSSPPLYLPYREIGLVCDSSPFVLAKRGTENFIVVPIDRFFQVVRVDKLTTVLISKQCAGRIESLAVRFVTVSFYVFTKTNSYVLQVHGNLTFASTGKRIFRYKRTEIVDEINQHHFPITGMSVVGDILLSYDTSGNVVVRFFVLMILSIMIVFFVRFMTLKQIRS